MINVVKHDGSLEPLNYDKASASLTWAIGNLERVSISEIEVQSKLHFFDGIHTSYITDIFIKTCDDLATLKHQNYDAVARNLKIQRLYKRAFNSIHPPTLQAFLEERIATKDYSPALLGNSNLNYELLNQTIDHSRDFTFTSSGLDALINGYGVCKKETPQFIFMAIAIDIFRDYHINPMDYIISFYNAISTYQITLPTPEMLALRTLSTDYASCITIRMGDTVDSWKATSNAIVDHTCASAGVGVDIADVSSLGDKVKQGKITHSGKIPIIKSIDTDIGKSSQIGRRGSATPNFNFFDPEIENIFALKSPRMPVEDRINDLSYTVKVNQLVYDRAKQKRPISLFSVRQAPKLLELFYSTDIDAFITYYEECEAQNLYSSQIDAEDFWTRLVAVESSETSAYYILNIDEVNKNSHITRPITMSNICLEYMTAIQPLSLANPDSPDIGVCVLSNVNQGRVSIEELPKIMDLLVRAQSHIMTRQVHPTSQANAYVKHYHDIGIGLSNHAYWLANQNLRYGQTLALYEHDRWMEHFSFYAHTTSVNLAIELGTAPGFEYHAKILPINRYNKNCDDLVQRPYECDWKNLGLTIQQYGMYNVGLMMVPPAETSAGPSNQTTGLEPIKNLLTIKDKSGVNFKQFAPDCIRLADKYDFAYDRDINSDYIKHVVITQKWLDKGISANTFYSPKWNNGKILASSIIEGLFLLKYFGGKGRYYQNTEIPDEIDLEIQTCQGGCSV